MKYRALYINKTNNDVISQTRKIGIHGRPEELVSMVDQKSQYPWQTGKVGIHGRPEEQVSMVDQKRWYQCVANNLKFY